MTRPHKPKLLLGGACAVSTLAFKASDREELSKLPAALVLLLEIIQTPADDPKLRRAAVKALGCTLAALTPHAPPHHVPEVDRGVQALIAQLLQPPAKQVHTEENAYKDSWWSGDDGKDGYDVPVAPVTQAAAEAIGRIALTTSAWRPVLRSCAMEALTNWIRYGLPDRKLNKYLFWAAAAMSGMPFVANEVKLHMNSVSAVDAALCTIIDILDEDIDGEYTLAGADRGEAEMPDLLGLIVQAMGLHSGAPEIQARGSTCISLLVPYVPFAKLSAVAPVAIVSVLTGHRRFPRRMDVMSGSACALRAFCELCRRHQGAEGTEVIVSRLRQEGASECMEQVFMGFSHYEDASELLEDAAAVHAQLSGVEALLKRLAEEPATSLLRVAGLKAIFEEGRLDMDFFSGRAAATAIEACERMVLEARADEDGRRSPRIHPLTPLGSMRSRPWSRVFVEVGWRPWGSTCGGWWKSSG
ncbi:unnamed protein product [Durusdinium trenchii]|uniref:Tubulin-specific chaperone D n=1 Tax=Durusdinium trenchii TaxID=1381693 RepID=A0ABP0HR53_9DINO